MGFVLQFGRVRRGGKPKLPLIIFRQRSGSQYKAVISINVAQQPLNPSEDRIDGVNEI